MKKQEKDKAPAGKKTDKKNTGSTVLWEKPYFFEILIFCFSFLLFANSIRNDYNLDDELVTINHRLTSKGISAIPEIFQSPYYQDASGYAYEYRPVVLVSFALEHDIFGDNPHWSHFWNVLLYSLSCVLLYRVLKTLFRQSVLPLLITLLFVAHPSHTEVVCSIKNRDEILGLIFSLGAFHYAIQFVKGRFWVILWVFLLFTLALLSKATFVTFAVIIPLTIVLFEGFSLITITTLTLVILGPSVVIVNLGDTLVRLVILLGGVALSGIAFIVRYPTVVRHFLSSVGGRILQPGAFVWNTGEVSPLTLKELLNSFIAPFSQIVPGILVSNLIMVLTYSVAAYYNIYYLQILLALIWTALLFEKNWRENWLTYFFVYWIIIFKLYHLGVYTQHYAIDFLLFIASYYIIYGSRKLLLPSFIAFLSIIVFYIITPGNGGGVALPFIALAMLYSLRFRWAFIVIVIHFIVQVSTDLSETPLPSSEAVVSLIFNIAFALFLFSIYLKKQSWNLPKIYLIVALVGVSIINWQHRRDDVLVQRSIFQLSTTTIKVSPKTEVRPILYVENVIDSKTPVSTKAGTSFEILVHYLTKTILPYPLSYYYGYSFIKPMQMTEPISILGLVLYLLLILTTVLIYKKYPLVSFGVLLYLISISIYSNYFATAPGMIADRFLLVPSLGWAILFASALQIIFDQTETSDVKELLVNMPRNMIVVFLLLLGTYSTLSFIRTFDWKDYLTLFEHDIHYVDNSAQAHNLLAIRLMKTSYDPGTPPGDQIDMRKKALGHFERAIQIYPPFFNATYDAGRVHQTLGNADSSVFYYAKALKIDSSFTPAALAAGDILSSQNKFSEAIFYYEMPIRAFPKEYEAYEKLGNTYFMLKDYPHSIAVLKKANEEMPQNHLPRIALAKIYHGMNMNDSTKYWLQKAIEINPSDPQAQNLLKSLDHP